MVMFKRVVDVDDNRSYILEIYDDGEIDFRRYTRMLRDDDFHNGTNDVYEIIPSKKGVKVRICGYNCTWACRGHGMDDFWTDAEEEISKRDYKWIKEEALRQVKNTSEDEFLDFFIEVKSLIEDTCNFYVDEEYSEEYDDEYKGDDYKYLKEA